MAFALAIGIGRWCYGALVTITVA